MKIFISYSSGDLALAERVFGEMVRGGAETFQFGKTEVIGKPSWTQVLDWISESDVFIVLVSQSALRSKPVKEELDHAHHSYINSGNPEKLVAAVIESGVKPPRLIERFARVDLVDYEAGMTRLMTQLGLERKSAGRAIREPTVSLPDFGSLFSEFKRKRPAPSAASQFSTKAERLVANYDLVKPKGIRGLQRARHIDSLLAELADAPSPPATPALEEADALFLGYQPPATFLARPKLAESLLNWKPVHQPLVAPTLQWSGLYLEWTEVPEALGYALEGLNAAHFAGATEMYRGLDKQYMTIQTTFTHFRVKAIGGVFTADSRWSNVVPESTLAQIFRPVPGRRASLSREKLTAPELTLFAPGLAALHWSAVEKASGYVLERADTIAFHSPQQIDKGLQTTHFEMGRPIMDPPDVYYRVKAVGDRTHDDSDWSDVLVLEG